MTRYKKPGIVRARGNLTDKQEQGRSMRLWAQRQLFSRFCLSSQQYKTLLILSRSASVTTRGKFSIKPQKVNTVNRPLDTFTTVMEREFAYYNPASNRISFPHMANADETIYAGNPFGKCQDSYGYKRIPRDKQTIPRDCDVIPRSMSSVSVFQQIPGETVFSTPGAVSPSAEGLSSRSGKRAFDSRAISNPKRSRTVFQPHQLRRLQYEFDREMYMVGMKRRNLSKELDLSEKQIKIWFQNRRMKQKREHNRKRNRSFENLQKVCADPNRYFDEFGGLEALDISDSRNANNPRMLML